MPHSGRKEAVAEYSTEGDWPLKLRTAQPWFATVYGYFLQALHSLVIETPCCGNGVRVLQHRGFTHPCSTRPRLLGHYGHHLDPSLLQGVFILDG
eukprot:5816739-Amphidinium_carterae.2